MKSIFRKEAVEFKSRGMYGDALLVTSIAWNRLFVAGIYTLLFTFSVAYISTIDSPISVNGLYYESTNSGSIYAKRSGIIETLNVEQTTTVKTGTLLSSVIHDYDNSIYLVSLENAIEASTSIARKIDYFIQTVPATGELLGKTRSRISEVSNDIKQHAEELLAIRTSRMQALASTTAVSGDEKTESKVRFLDAYSNMAKLNEDIENRSIEWISDQQSLRTNVLEWTRLQSQLAVTKSQLIKEWEIENRKRVSAIYSPFNGSVNSIFTKVGDTIEIGDEMFIISPVNPEPIVYAYLSSSDLTRIDRASSVKVNFTNQILSQRLILKGNIQAITEPIDGSSQILADASSRKFRAIIRLNISDSELVEVNKLGVRNGFVVKVLFKKQPRRFI